MGEIPPDLDGRLLRIGPNPVAPPDPSTYHWFTGTGMVHGLRLRDGQAEWYRNRFVRNGDVVEARGVAAGPRSAGGDVRRRQHQRDRPGGQDVRDRRGRLAAGRADPRSRDGGQQRLRRTLPAGFTAHPHRDPDTGELHAVAYQWDLPTSSTSPSEPTERSARRSRPSGRRADGARLRHHRVERAAVRSAGHVRPRARHGGTASPTDGTRATARASVCCRATVRPMTFAGARSPLCYVFHPLNAYDLPDGRIVVDVVRHPPMFDADHHRAERGPARCSSGGPSTRPTGTTSTETISRSRPGVPAARRATHRSTPSVRLQRVVRRTAGTRPIARLDPQARRRAGKHRGARLRARRRSPGAGLRATSGRQRRGRRLGDGVRPRPRPQRAPTCTSSTPRTSRRTRRNHPSPRPRALWLPRELGRRVRFLTSCPARRAGEITKSGLADAPFG